MDELRNRDLESRFRELFEAAGFDLEQTVWTRVTDVPRRDDYPSGDWFRVLTEIGPILIGSCANPQVRIDWDEIGREVDNRLFVNPARLVEGGHNWVHVSSDDRITLYLVAIRKALATFTRLEVVTFITNVDFVLNPDKLSRNIMHRMLGREPKVDDKTTFAIEKRKCLADLRSRQLQDQGLPDPAAISRLCQELQNGHAESNPEVASGLKHTFMVDACGRMPTRLKIELLPESLRTRPNQ